MLGIGKKIEKLGEELSGAFTDRARHYFLQGKTGDIPKETANIMGAVLGEVAAVILNVTKREGKADEG